MEGGNMVDKKEIIEKVDWNLRQALGFQIANLLETSSKYAVVYDYHQAYRRLKSIKGLVIFKLEKKEREKMSSIEKKVEFRIALMKRIVALKKEIKTTRYNYQAPRDLSELLKLQQRRPLHLAYEHYQITLMDMLNKYGFLMGIKEDPTNIAYD